MYSTNAVDNGAGIDYTYDEVGRVSAIARGTASANAGGTVTVTGIAALGTTFTYAAGDGANATTSLVAGIAHGTGEAALTFGYEYDDVGNITQETRDGATTTYEYDHLGQLTRVNDPNDTASGATGTTWVYGYDCGGNILCKARYGYTTGSLEGLTPQETIPYTYGNVGWKDQLTAYNGQAITYDGIGNPLSDEAWTYTWQAGRQLAGMTKGAGNKTVAFTYNHDGLRTKKTVTENGVTTATEYLLHGKLVTGLKQGNTELHFFYRRSRRNLRFPARRMLRMLCFAS